MQVCQGADTHKPHYLCTDTLHTTEQAILFPYLCLQTKHCPVLIGEETPTQLVQQDCNQVFQSPLRLDNTLGSLHIRNYVLSVPC